MESRTILNEINFASVSVAARTLQCWGVHRRDQWNNKVLNIEGRHAWARPTHRGIAFSVKLISFRIDSAHRKDSNVFDEKCGGFLIIVFLDFLRCRSEVWSKNPGRGPARTTMQSEYNGTWEAYMHGLCDS